MFIELIPQRKSHGGGRRGKELGIFFFVTEDRFFFFKSLLDGKKSAEQLHCWETILFPSLLSPKEEFTPCVGFLPCWGWKGPFPSHGMCKRFHVEYAGHSSAEHSDWFDWDVSSKNIQCL